MALTKILRSLLASDRRSVLIIASSALLGAALYFWLAQFDPLYRTIFIEEYHSGEAGRAAYLFGEFQGEGGGYQSKVAAPAASMLSWASFELFGLGRYQLRLPFVLIAIGSIITMGLALRRETKSDHTLFATAMLAFTVSPLLLNLRASSLNEILYVAVISAVFMVAGALESAPLGRRRLFLAFLLAVTAGLAVFIKFDGVMVPAAALIVIALRLRAKCISFTDAAWFAAGGIFIAGAYVATQMWASGVPGLAASFAWGADAMKAAPHWPHTAMERITRTLISAPKNFNLLFPGISLLIILIGSLAVFCCKRLSLAGQIALVILAGFFLVAPYLPLVYWKRVLYAAPAAWFLAVAAWNVWRDLPAPLATRIDRMTHYSAPVSVVVGIAAIVSPFLGMWNVIPLGQWGAREIAVTVFCAATAAAVAWRGLDARRFRLVLIILCGGTIIFGAAELPAKRGRAAADIGAEVAAITDGSFVVGDHNAFRIAGYSTNARFRFVHENDIRFPGLVIDLAKELNPEFVAVTNSYRDLGSMVKSDLPGYRLVLERSFENPPTYFRRIVTTHTLMVFKRTGEAQPPGP